MNNDTGLRMAENLKSKTRLFLLCIALAFISVAAGPTKPTLAVLELEAINIKKSDVLALTEKLRYEMFSMGKYTLLERTEMESILKEQGFQQSGCVSAACAVQAGQLLGVTYMLTGSVSSVGSVFLIALRMVDVGTSEIIKSVETQTNGSLESVLTDGLREAAGKLYGFENARASEGSLPRWTRHGLKWGLENDKGVAITMPKYGKVRRFSDGFAAVKRSGLWGYVNTSGEEIIPAQFIQADDFKNGAAKVCLGNPYRAFIIDKAGNKVKDLPLGAK